MCAFFGRGLIVYEVPLRIRASGAVGGVPPFDLAFGRVSPLATEVRGVSPVIVAPATRGLSVPALPAVGVERPPDRVAPPAAIHGLRWPPLRTASRSAALPPFVAPVRTAEPLSRPRIRDDLAAARAQLVCKRLVPADRLAPEEAARWVRRLADSKKMAKTRLVLVGVFPDVPVSEGAPVRYDAQAGAIAYALPEAPIPLSTVVVARRTDTGVAVIGRFYR